MQGKTEEVLINRRKKKNQQRSKEKKTEEVAQENQVYPLHDGGLYHEFELSVKYFSGLTFFHAPFLYFTGQFFIYHLDFSNFSLRKSKGREYH
jgi:hypothetical protein